MCEIYIFFIAVNFIDLSFVFATAMKINNFESKFLLVKSIDSVASLLSLGQKFLEHPKRCDHTDTSHVFTQQRNVSIKHKSNEHYDVEKLSSDLTA